MIFDCIPRGTTHALREDAQVPIVSPGEALRFNNLKVALNLPDFNR
jgi:hypothetical protein